MTQSFKLGMILVVVPIFRLIPQCYALAVALLLSYLAIFHWLMNEVALWRSLKYFILTLPMWIACVLMLFCSCMFIFDNYSLFFLALLSLCSTIYDIKHISLRCKNLCMTFWITTVGFCCLILLCKNTFTEGVAELTLLLFFSCAATIATWNINFKQWLRDTFFSVLDFCTIVPMCASISLRIV